MIYGSCDQENFDFMSVKEQRAALISDLSRAFTEQLDLEQLLPLVITSCRETLDAEGVSVLLLDRERNELYFPYASQADPEVGPRLTNLRFPADSGIAGAVLKSGRAERIDDPASDHRFYPKVDRRTGVTTRSILAVPLVARGEVVGVIEAVNRRDGPFVKEDLSFLETLAESVAIALRNANRFAEVRGSEQAPRKQVVELRRDLLRRDIEREIIGTSPAITQIFHLIASAAASSIPVLIEGETGTGKELVARAIHRTSARADGPFLAINCAAFTETLLESELFGHRRGAFTGATSDEPGLFRAANGGVIFLDEIGEMPMSAQAKLLRVVQEGEVTAVGETRPQRVDVRVLSASNRDLAAAIAAKTFREDLYYRLAVFPIHLPPLRDRREDIPLLASRFLAASAQRNSKQIVNIEAEALDALVRFDWPGNVRQLQSEIERAVALMADGQSISLAHLSAALTRVRVVKSTAEASLVGGLPASLVDELVGDSQPLAKARAEFEARYIASVLARHQGNTRSRSNAVGINAKRQPTVIRPRLSCASI